MRARQGIILGYENATESSFGFAHATGKAKAGDPIYYDGDAPICCIASTGSGKGRSLIVPLLLTAPEPVIAIDIKGELSAICRRARMAMGHRVAIIDPFGVTGHTSDRLNPFDLFSLPGSMLEADAEMLATLLGEGHEFKSDPFWTDAATGFISGLIAHVAADPDPAKRGMTQLRKMLYTEDVDYQLAVLLDQKAHRTQLAYDEISSYLQICGERTRPCVLSTTRTYLRALNSEQVAACIEDSNIHLPDIVAGKPLDVFIVVPPDKLKSHRCMLRLLIGTLLTAIMRRKRIPDRRTIFVIDEAAALGKEFEPLLTAATLMRGYGLGLVTIWQDLAQIKSRYPTDFATILNNTAALLAFGFGHHAACKEYSELTGLDPRELMSLDGDSAVLSLREKGVSVIKKLDYLKDRIFEGKYDQNPYYGSEGIER